MNEHLVRRALKELIMDNADILVTDLTLQGNPVEIAGVSTSGSTPEGGYPFIHIIVLNGQERPTSQNVQKPRMDAVYSCVLFLKSLSELSPDDQEAFEVADEVHQLLGDRLINLIGDQRFIATDVTPTEQARFEPDRTTFAKNNSGVTWESDNGITVRVASEIRFTLIERCLDAENLYR